MMRRSSLRTRTDSFTISDVRTDLWSSMALTPYMMKELTLKRLTNMEINTIEIAGIASALTALRLPFGKEVRSDITADLFSSMKEQEIDIKKIDDEYQATFHILPCIESHTDILIEPKDLTLMQTLIKRGDEHAKVIRGIVVWARITAPVYWWCEEETYRAGHERLSSESTMHIDCQGLSGEELQKAKSEIPMGKELTKVDMFSYQCLRNIVRQRHNHRLQEWHQFIDWIRTLPLAEELIFVGLDLED